MINIRLVDLLRSTDSRRTRLVVLPPVELLSRYLAPILLVRVFCTIYIYIYIILIFNFFVLLNYSNLFKFIINLNIYIYIINVILKNII